MGIDIYMCIQWLLGLANTRSMCLIKCVGGSVSDFILERVISFE